ncbi:MAG: hypothetical protein H6850_04710 [Alphaproteobacteria bacterium]|nr:MAG: hypothetical protein H6850_04710 [Alphaproteobacteria bacterium]
MEYLNWCKEKRDHATPGWILDIIFHNPRQHQKIDYVFEQKHLYAYDYKQHSDVSECIDYPNAAIKFQFCKEYHVLKEQMMKNRLLDVALYKVFKWEMVRAIAFHKCNITELSEYNGEILMKFSYMEESTSFKTERGIHATNLNFEKYTTYESKYKNINEYLKYSDAKRPR